MSNKRKHRQLTQKYTNGFTLIETLITLAIIAILLSVSHMGFYALSAKSEAKALIQELSSAVRFARMQALNHHQNTILCPYGSASSCGDDWLKGYIVFRDNNQDNTLSNADSILYQQANSKKQGSLTWTALRNYLEFSPTGISSGNSGTFIYCPGNKDPHYAQALIINFSGKVRIAIDKDRDGIKESGNRRNIECG